MPRFAANLSMMYAEHPFLERFGAAAADGFDAVEYLFPYEHPPEVIAQTLQRHGLTQALFNLPPGDFAAGERGIACLPGREAQFRESVQTALRYAQATGCRRLHIMAGLVPPGVPREQLHATYVSNLRLACDLLAPHGIEAMIEPINQRDIPGYFLSLQAQGHAVREEVARSNLKVQMDFYHCQIMEGDLSKRFELHQAGIGHVQIAGVPARHEPDEGEVNYPHLFRLLDERGYDGFVGCEYRPRGATSAGLGWLRAWRQSQAAQAIHAKEAA
jgi:hydroxypyruvate isomerase